MINVKVLASGSSGNCTVLKTGNTIILLDAGIKFSRIQQALKFKNPTAALITHEHGDHAQKSTIRELLKRGVDVYMTCGTAEALGLEGNHRLHYVEEGRGYFLADSAAMMAVGVNHDAKEPVAFVVSDGEDTLWYLTDLGEIKADFCGNVNFDLPTKILVEANYDDQLIEESRETSLTLKRRIKGAHLSLEQVIDFLGLQRANNKKLTEVWLMHISQRHGDRELFSTLVDKMAIHGGAVIHVA